MPSPNGPATSTITNNRNRNPRYIFRFIGILDGTSVLSLALIFGVLSMPLTVNARRHFTVPDSIEMLRFSTGTEEDAGPIARFSPDGRYFIVVIKRGVLQSDEIESTIWLFKGDEGSLGLDETATERPAEPKAVVRMSAATNGDPISDIRWQPDGHTIAFLGRNHSDERHLFVLDINEGHLAQLTPQGIDITGFDGAENTFIVSAQRPIPDSELYQSAGPGLQDIQVGTGLSIFSLLYPHWEEVTFGISSQSLMELSGGKTFTVRSAATSAPIVLTRGRPVSLLSLSPSGRYVVATNNVERVPTDWEKYEPAFSFGTFVASDANTPPPTSDLSPAQYLLIDLHDGKVSSLIDAPLGWSAGYFADVPTAKWSADEREVAVSNTFVPFANDGRVRTMRPCVAVVDIHSRHVECVKEADPVVPGKLRNAISEIEWGDVNQLVLRYQSTDEPSQLTIEVLKREDGTWRSADGILGLQSAGPATEKNLTITLQEAINDPPVLIATDRKTGRSKQIWNPNPQLSEIQLGEATVFKWRDKAGHLWTGGLVKPPDYIMGHRYPLVIQTHGFNQNQFLADGIYSTANAARGLAGRGIMVLQVAEIRAAQSFTPEEAEVDARAGYESAIQQLASDGLIEPDKIGIIGFSRTGWYVLDCLIHCQEHFLAATLAESTYESLGEYLLNADYRSSEPAKGLASAMGNSPFGEGIRQWLISSPGFNTDKIHTPILFEANDPPALVYAWDMYAALRLQAKPAEMVYMRNGQHVLTKPREVLASQSMTVDWYDFWLNGHEDRDPQKSAQYVRWREFRKVQTRNQEQQE